VVYSADMTKDWASDQAARIGDEIKRLRGGRSGQWLSDQTDALGYRVARTTISELENHKRKYVSTAELAILARALDTAPIALLYPPPYHAEVEVLPGVEITNWSAAQWFSGVEDADSASAVTHDPDAYTRNLGPLRDAARISALEERKVRLLSLLDEIKPKPGSLLFFEVEDVQQQIHDLLVQSGQAEPFTDEDD
jgi:hypothetical protein